MITTKEVQKMMSTDSKIKLDVKMKLDVVCIQEDTDMGTADALRHIQQKIKVCVFLLIIAFGVAKTLRLKSLSASSPLS